MIPVTCQSCGYANEPTRVFCHQCGVRLEKPADAPEKAEPPPAPLRKVGVPAKAKPAEEREFSVFSLVYSVVGTGVFAALLAILLLALRPPENLPPPASPNAAGAVILQDRLNKAAAPSPFARQFSATSDEVRSYLASQVTINARSLAFSQANTRPLLILENGAFVVGIEIETLGQRIVLQSRQAVGGTPGQLTVKDVGCQIGSLPVPAVAWGIFTRWTESFADAFSSQLSQIQSAEKVVITPENVQISWAPKP